jgi:hypothetical protein
MNILFETRQENVCHIYYVQVKCLNETESLLLILKRIKTLKTEMKMLKTLKFSIVQSRIVKPSKFQVHSQTNFTKSKPLIFKVATVATLFQRSIYHSSIKHYWIAFILIILCYFVSFLSRSHKSSKRKINHFSICRRWVKLISTCACANWTVFVKMGNVFSSPSNLSDLFPYSVLCWCRNLLWVF